MWAVRLIASSRKGTGAVVSPTLILTCRHVVRDVNRATVRREFGSTVINSSSALPSSVRLRAGR
jgi:hypothetical protein